MFIWMWGNASISTVGYRRLSLTLESTVNIKACAGVGNLQTKMLCKFIQVFEVWKLKKLHSNSVVQKAYNHPCKLTSRFRFRQQLVAALPDSNLPSWVLLFLSMTVSYALNVVYLYVEVSRGYGIFLSV